MMTTYINSLNRQKIKEYTSYFEGSYGADYRPHQGLNEITDMIFKFSTPGTWIDLGGGTSTFIWLPAFKLITTARSVDKYIESSYVQERVRYSCRSGCYSHVLKRYRKRTTDLDKIPIIYSQMDLLGDFADDKKYNNVSQLGLLGLCQSAQEYVEKLDKFMCFMDKNAVFFGANWVFSAKYAERKGFSNTYLATTLIENYSKSAAKMLLFSDRILISGDPNYEAVLIYTLKNV